MGAVFFNVALQYTAIAILFFLLIYSVLQKPSEMQKHAIVLINASILFLAGYLIRLQSNTMEMAHIGATVSYIGQPFILLSAMMLISTFYGYKIPKWVYILLASYSALIPVAVYTNNYHYLFYDTVSFDPGSAYSPLITTHGIIYNINVIVSLCYFVAYNFMIMHGYHKSESSVKKRLSVYSILMLVSGMAGYLFYFLNLTDGYDTTMTGMFFASVFLFILFFRCRIFDIVDKAKDYALDNSSEGLVVFDDSGRTVYKNSAADIFIETGIPMEYIDNSDAGESIFTNGDRHYSVRIQKIMNRDDYLGKSVAIYDVTSTINHQAQLEKAVNETTERLEKIQRTIFGSMASIVEARSIETGDHIRRVGMYAEMIAKSLRRLGIHTDILTDEYINILVLASPLHDIGKISIPDAILLKPGRLTDEEFEIMKTHSIKGKEIINSTMKGLESEEYISMASDLAEFHHEKWDGTGYPHGTKGNDIPLCARIVALADCYDAMTSKRCYKAAFPDEKAIAIIKEESGTHFDPDVVNAFLNISISNLEF